MILAPVARSALGSLTSVSPGVAEVGSTYHNASPSTSVYCNSLPSVVMPMPVLAIARINYSSLPTQLGVVVIACEQTNY